jgi:hypothetical protein
LVDNDLDEEFAVCRVQHEEWGNQAGEPEFLHHPCCTRHSAGIAVKSLSIHHLPSNFECSIDAALDPWQR